MDIRHLKLETLNLIEEDIYARLVRISLGEAGYSTKYFHLPFIKKHTIRIHSPEQLIRNGNPFLTEDRLAHQMSFFGDEFPENFYRAVDHIVLIPEFVCGNGFFLSHIYIPDKKILAFYIYPPRLQLDMETYQENRMTGRRIIRAGLLHNTAVTIAQIFESFKNNPPENNFHAHPRMHKFLHPSIELTNDEILSMTDFSDMTEFSKLSAGGSE